MNESIIEKAKQALEKEIEAVLKKPSSGVLNNGIKQKHDNDEESVFLFEKTIIPLKFVEDCTAYIDDLAVKAHPLDFSDKGMTILFEKDIPAETNQFHLEWENDFVLRKTLEKLEKLSKYEENGLLDEVFNELPEHLNRNEIELEAYDDNTRNEPQLKSIEKALNNPVTYVWGPPGTGKTSTLGYIIANFLLHGKRILFASNTNRSVDVGLLSVYDAIKSLDIEDDPFLLTRFGDIALENQILSELSFDNHIQNRLEKKKKRIVQGVEWLSKLNQIEDKVQELEFSNQPIPSFLKEQNEFLQTQVNNFGGRDQIENPKYQKINVNERFEIERFKLVATTLAKVCTSDLLDAIDFDVVVVDEASMASLPFMIVMASKALEHFIAVGDPMQLPPISMAEDFEARKFLEKDIFTWVSNSESMQDLFNWHDRNMNMTSFFNIQYRMPHDIAALISTTFYDGRLQTSDDKKINEPSHSSSHYIIDSQSLNPNLEKGKGSGFKPINKVHMQLVLDEIRNYLSEHIIQNQIGIIVPFNSVVWEYKKFLQKNGLRDIEVGTIHTFQGREKEIILFDTVMTGDKTGGYERHYTVRPFDEKKTGLQVARLLNVAFSRSKKSFSVIADLNHIKRAYKGRFLNKLLTRME